MPRCRVTTVLSLVLTFMSPPMARTSTELTRSQIPHPRSWVHAWYRSWPQTVQLSCSCSGERDRRMGEWRHQRLSLAAVPLHAHRRVSASKENVRAMTCFILCSGGQSWSKQTVPLCSALGIDCFDSGHCIAPAILPTRQCTVITYK